MKSLIIALLVLLAVPAFSAVIYRDSWEYKYVKQDLYGSQLSFNNGSADYCVNPDPPDDCSVYDCEQLVGPVVAVSGIPQTSCMHSINIGTGGTDGWPLPIDGDKIIRFYIDSDDSMVKGHKGGRAEMFCDENCDISPTETDRWYGYAMYLPSLAYTNFTYEGFAFQQFKNKYIGTGSEVPVYFYINGGTEHDWQDNIHMRVIYNSDYVAQDIAMTPTALVGTTLDRLSGSSNLGFILKDTGLNDDGDGSGETNDLGDWMYFVFVYHHDWRDTTTDGRFTMWYASQDRIDECGSGIDCYYKIYDEDPFTSGRTTDQQDTSIIRIGADYAGGTSVIGSRNSYEYPLINYRDNYKVSDGALGTDALNFAEVDPAIGIRQGNVLLP